MAAAKRLSVPPPHTGRRPTVASLSRDVAALLKAYAALHEDVKALRAELAAQKRSTTRPPKPV